MNSSETLKLQLTAFGNDISGNKASPILLGNVAAAAQFVQPANTGQSQITIGNSWYITPAQFVGVLAHEIGHYVNRFVDDAFWGQAVSSGKASEVQIACMGREGFAIANSLKVSAEIKATGGAGLVIPGQRGNDDLVTLASNQRQAYLANGASEKEADAAINLWLSDYNGQNRPSNLQNPENYAQWCLRVGAERVKKAPDTLQDYVYDPAAFDVTSTLSLDGQSTFTMKHGGATDLTCTPNNLGQWEISGSIVLPDSIDGIASPMTAQPDGSYNLATASGNINVKLSADPYGGGIVTVAGQTFQFDGADTLFAGNGGLWIQGEPINNAHFPGEFEMRLINANGSGTQLRYEQLNPELPPPPQNPLNGGYNIYSEVDTGWELVETTQIGIGSTGPTTNLATLSTTTTTATTGETFNDPTVAFNTQGIAASGGDWKLEMALNTLNVDAGYYAGVASDAGTDGWRPGNNGSSNTIAQTQSVASIADALASNQTAAAGAVLPDIAYAGANLANSGANTPLVPTDPLVLDLNGDGVKLTSFDTSPVLFDIDNDGGSLEQTGWVSAQDGIVVRDLNSNGLIDNSRETLSEYYNGVAGSNGTAGTKPFTNGFAALKSLDTGNGTAGSAGWNDNTFTVADTAWSSLRVWVDANHDGKTDAGELKTFAELGITAINLNSSSQSGEMRDGNEVLARGTFTQGGQTREAIAANFLANPFGSLSIALANGILFTTQGDATVGTAKTYVSTSQTGEVINLDITQPAGRSAKESAA